LMVLDRVVPPKVKKPDPVPPPARVQPPKAIAQKQLTRMVIVDNNKMPPNVATQDELKNAVIGTKNVDLPPGITTTPPLPPSTGSGTEVKAVEKKEPESEIIQREPEFPGGLQAWINFLNRNLRVPDELQAGEKKTVLIRFQVSPDGAVTGFEVMQSAGNLYDNEVIRVLKKMPRWKPAIQNNMAVSRTFTQPVTFMGVEE
jgi:protein TonB